MTATASGGSTPTSTSTSRPPPRSVVALEQEPAPSPGHHRQLDDAHRRDRSRRSFLAPQQELRSSCSAYPSRRSVGAKRPNDLLRPERGESPYLETTRTAWSERRVVEREIDVRPQDVLPRRVSSRSAQPDGAVRHRRRGAPTSPTRSARTSRPSTSRSASATRPKAREPRPHGREASLTISTTSSPASSATPSSR